MQSLTQKFVLSVAVLLIAAPAHATPSNQHAAATQATPARSGPFVASPRSLTELVGNGYEIRGTLGTALILQKGASIFSCQVPPDPERLSYKPYFICSELREEPPVSAAKPQRLPLPQHSRD